MGIDWGNFQDSNRNESGKAQQAEFGQRSALPRKNGVSGGCCRTIFRIMWRSGRFIVGL